MSEAVPVFRVPRLSAFGSRLLARHGALMERIGAVETKLLSDQLEVIDTSRPIFVCGLARSGTTILLELIAKHRDVASQRYLDYPFVFTPYLWNRYLSFARFGPESRVERAHRDGLMVSPHSPEAMEEPIWMRFFPESHNPTVSNIVDGQTTNTAFEAYYDAHMAKLLLARGRSRYVAKGNYHVARICYLARLYPQARFVIPVRDPVMHIASSIKQHRLFVKGQTQNTDARLHLSQGGHFEFGLDRTPINVDLEQTRRVLELWNDRDEIRGWAVYWAIIHDYIAEAIGNDSDLQDRVMLVPYERLCAEPVPMASKILDFCFLPEDPSVMAFAENQIRAQRYYEPGLSADDCARIRTETDASFRRFLTLVK